MSWLKSAARRVASLVIGIGHAVSEILHGHGTIPLPQHTPEPEEPRHEEPLGGEIISVESSHLDAKRGYRAFGSEEDEDE